jgi:protein TonB
MFEQTFVQTQAATRRPWTVAMSLSLQLAAVGAILLIPLLHPAVMRIPDPPKPPVIHTWASLAARPQREVSGARAPRTSSAIRVPKVYYPALRPLAPETREISVAPVAEASTIWRDTAAFAPVAGLTAAPLPSPPVKPAAQAPPARPAGPLRVSSGVESAKLMFSPRPVYPRVAIATRSQGAVRLEAIIATDGRIRNLRVLSGPPLLVKAALDAVQQWKYQPTLLNGAPVEVVTEVEVNFTLSR